MERAAVPGMIREQKLHQWIEDYSDSILRTCFLYLSDQNQAEDATQDTWIKAWKHMDDYERKSITNDMQYRNRKYMLLHRKMLKDSSPKNMVQTHWKNWVTIRLDISSRNWMMKKILKQKQHS